MKWKNRGESKRFFVVVFLLLTFDVCFDRFVFELVAWRDFWTNKHTSHFKNSSTGRNWTFEVEYPVLAPDLFQRGGICIMRLL